MLKTLWIMRHGLAEAHFESDRTRPLSKRGEKQAGDVIQQLMDDSDGLLPTEMLVSPFKRTQQTAQVVHRLLALPSRFETEEMLVHFADHELLGDYLLASDYENLLIVSHMPIVARLCQYLSPKCDIYGFETAQLVRMSFREDSLGYQVGQVEKVYRSKL